MRRRLDIAASLVVTPELLFLDEPTTGLDPRSRNQVWDIIRLLVRNGTTVLLTTQYLEEADQLADRIAVIDHGTRDRRGHERRAEGLGRHRRAPCPPRRRRPTASGARRLLAARFGEAVQRDNDPRALTRAARRSRPRRGRPRRPRRRPASRVSEFSLGQPSLDEVFFALTGHPAEREDGRRTRGRTGWRE